MNMYELTILKAVVEQRGFGRAAKVTHVSQSAVSQAIRRLEDEVGVPLIERGRPPRLTAAGERIYAHAVDTLGRDELVRRQIEELKKGHRGIIVLAASEALSRELLPELVERFIVANPTAGLQLEALPSRQVIAAAAEGRIELGLAPFARAMAGLETKALGKQRLILYAGHRAPHLAQLRQGRLTGAALVTSHLDASHGRRGLLRDHFGAVWVVQSLDLRLRLIQEGHAVGYLPESTVRSTGLHKALVALSSLPFGAITRTYGLIFSAKRTLSPAAQAFVALAR